jgi:hypothetical protein
MLLTIALTAALATAQTISPQEPASIEGRVVHAVTGEGLRSATFLVQILPAPGPAARERQIFFYTTTTDSAGHFELKDLEPGNYGALIASRPGFSRDQQGGTVTLQPGEKRKVPDFKLTPQSVISGKILDEDGEPMIGVSVSLLQSRYLNGIKRLESQGTLTSDDRGAYRMPGLSAGKFYLVASLPTGQNPGMIDRTESNEAFVPTYFPGVTDSASAQPVTVQQGFELQGQNIVMKRVKTVSVSGRLQSPVENPEGNYYIELHPKEGRSAPGFQQRVIAMPRHEFTFRGVLPGTYTLLASADQGNVRHQLQQRIDVGGEDVANVVLDIPPGVDLTGQLELEDPASASIAMPQVILNPSPGSLLRQISAPVDAQREFVLPAVAATRYRVGLAQLPAGSYIKSATLNGVEVLDSGIDLAKISPGPLRVVLSTKGAKVSGSVQDKDSKSVPSAWVVLVPEKAILRDDPQSYRTASTGPDGAFTMQPVRPGDYRAYAWKPSPGGAYLDPEFMRLYAGKGKLITVAESSNQTITLEVLPGDLP